MNALQWEVIDPYHQRAKVIGGWLVKAYEDVLTQGTGFTAVGKNGYEWRMAMTFIPDQGHYWGSQDHKGQL
jgi:hypothetical protein